MASRLLRGARALAVQALRACGPARMAAPSMVTGGGIPSDEATGLEREIMMATRNDLDPYNMLAPKAALGTKEEPNLVPSITDKRIVGCICEEDNSAVIWFWLHKGETHIALTVEPITSWYPTSLATEPLNWFT